MKVRHHPRIRNKTFKEYFLESLMIFPAIVLLNGICHGQTIDQTQTHFSSGNFSTQIAKAQMLIDSLMKAKHIPGLSVCIATKDQIIWAQGFGYADLENKTPVTLQSKFRVGSISKTLTALALGKLMDEHKLSLSDPVQKYVPGFPEKSYPITLYELASHTAGIRDYNYRNREFLSSKNYTSIKESLSIFQNDSLLFKPGTKYSYSTYGYVLLSAAIEGATHQDFLTYMQDSIFLALNLKNTVPDFNDSIIANRTRFYDESNGHIVNAYHVDNSNKWAGGGFLSTPIDLAYMSQGLLKYQFLKQATVEKFWSADTLQNGKKIAYGIGWKLDTDRLNRKYVYHGGSSIGGRSFLLVYPNEQWIIAITCDLSTDFDQQFILKITDLFM